MQYRIFRGGSGRIENQLTETNSGIGPGTGKNSLSTPPFRKGLGSANRFHSRSPTGLVPGRAQVVMRRIPSLRLSSRCEPFVREWGRKTGSHCRVTFASATRIWHQSARSWPLPGSALPDGGVPAVRSSVLVLLAASHGPGEAPQKDEDRNMLPRSPNPLPWQVDQPGTLTTSPNPTSRPDEYRNQKLVHENGPPWGLPRNHGPHGNAPDEDHRGNSQGEERSAA